MSQQLLKFAAVQEKLGGISRSKLYGLLKLEGFRRPVAGMGMPLWREADLDSWISALQPEEA